MENQKPDQNDTKISQPMTVSFVTEQTPLIRITQGDFDEILRQHKRWVDNSFTVGKRAELSRHDLAKLKFPMFVDLRYADLEHANLSGVKLHAPKFDRALLVGANFNGATLIPCSQRMLRQGEVVYSRLPASFQYTDLSDACFEDADLTEADLEFTNLLGANLHNSRLCNANLWNSRNLLVGQLQGADISGAQLPSNVGTFDALSISSELAHDAKRLYAALLIACSYCLLTVATTSHESLLGTSTSTELPIIGAQIPMLLFYVVAPSLLTGIFLYFQVYLQRLWESAATLPAFFPDGRSVDRKISPWLLTGLLREHYRLLQTRKPAFFAIQKVMVVFSTWMVVPFTCVTFWFSYLPPRSWTMTLYHSVLCTATIWISVFFYRTARLTMRQGQRPPIGSQLLSGGLNVALHMALILMILGLFLAISYFSGSVWAALL